MSQTESFNKSVSQSVLKIVLHLTETWMRPNHGEGEALWQTDIAQKMSRNTPFSSNLDREFFIRQTFMNIKNIKKRTQNWNILKPVWKKKNTPEEVGGWSKKAWHIVYIEDLLSDAVFCWKVLTSTDTKNFLCQLFDSLLMRDMFVPFTI